MIVKFNYDNYRLKGTDGTRILLPASHIYKLSAADAAVGTDRSCYFIGFSRAGNEVFRTFRKCAFTKSQGIFILNLP